MAIDATEIYCRFGNEHNLDLNLLRNVEETPLRTHRTNWVRTVEDSKVLNERKGPIIIISASGMCEGGRIVHHLKRRLPDPRNAVLFVGFQVEGTRGHKLLKGAEEVKIHGESVPVRAEIDSLNTLSAHGDYHDILKWLSGFKRPPKRTFIVHGELEAASSLKDKIEKQLSWLVKIPEHLEAADLYLA
jgi:metallo-beta-lactamase family protein